MNEYLLNFDLNQNFGKFKYLNATNGGPWHKRHASDMQRSNFKAYKEARIPFSRNHDSAIHSVYGGPYSHDISCIFPNFDADENDPNSYDFACTDESILICLDAGTETFFRLGQTIEHQVKKHGTIPPKDFKKWAVICEHIIRHYNEGWADGFNLNIKYWEIWNEPDLDSDNSTNKRTWGGTKEQFFDLYEITAKHLKNCFPNLKIGGPAIAGSIPWAEDFLCEMQKRNVPIDFFSWHIYCTSPELIFERSNIFRDLLDKYAYNQTENHLNEWNYIRNFTKDFVYSIEQIIGIKGAAYIMAVFSIMQRSTIDMLMYYDTRPSVFNGVFDYYTYRPLKGYYPFKWYGKLYDCEYEIRSTNKIDDVYSLCGVDKNGKITAIITHYSDNDEAKSKNIEINFGKNSLYDIYLLDENNDETLIATTSDLKFKLNVNSCLLIVEK